MKEFYTVLGFVVFWLAAVCFLLVCILFLIEWLESITWLNNWFVVTFRRKSLKRKICNMETGAIKSLIYCYEIRTYKLSRYEQIGIDIAKNEVKRRLELNL